MKKKKVNYTSYTTFIQPYYCSGSYVLKVMAHGGLFIWKKCSVKSAEKIGPNFKSAVDFFSELSGLKCVQVLGPKLGF